MEEPRNLTREDIEKKNYSFVRVYIKSFEESPHGESFLVPSKYKDDALRLAKLYVTEKGWEVASMPRGVGTSCKCCGQYYIYTRNYVKEARQLFRDGKYYRYDL